MLPTTYQFSNATKSILEDQFQVFSALINSFIEATEKLNDLNMAVMKASVGESGEIAKRLLSIKDHAELLCFISEQPKVVTEKLHFYNQHLTKISSEMKSNADKILEGQFIRAKDNVTTLYSELTENAPAGSSEKVMAVFESGYEQMNKVAKQVVETVGSTMSKVTEQFAQSVENNNLKVAKKKN